MSASTRATPRTVRFSVWLCSRLLVAYPQAFRRRYGAQMVQVFRDCCREATATNGIVGLIRYWLIAFGDLVVSALAERRREELHMTRTLWIRVGSLSAIIGGGIAAVFAGMSLASAIALLLDENSTLGPAIFQAHIVTWGAPALTVFYVLTLIGLQGLSEARAASLGWVAITAAILGTIIVGLGYGLAVSVMYSQADTCIDIHNCSFYDPNHYVSMGVMTGLFGTVIFAIGMIIYGIVALRRRVLPKRNWLLLATSLIALLNVAASVITLNVNGGSDSAGIQKVAIMLSGVALAFAILWILLGVTMWPHRNEQAATRDILAPVQPAT